MLYIVLFLHQTATVHTFKGTDGLLYIVLFLHQTATSELSFSFSFSCISFYSYIKPQLTGCAMRLQMVVYRSIPTSNRNTTYLHLFDFVVVYRSIPTSNRNSTGEDVKTRFVVYRSIPTSNRNLVSFTSSRPPLYIVLFLHQTATCRKPCFCQVWLYIVLFLHQTATRCRNSPRCLCCISFYSYIKPQRNGRACMQVVGCISFYSYIKPQQHL